MSIARRWLAGAVVLLVTGLPARATPAEGGDDPTAAADDPTLIALAVALSCAEPPESAAGRDGTAPARDAEMELVATVRARTLRFDEVPSAEALLRAAAGGKVTWRAERVNLPLHPVPGVVYRDVRVRLTVGSDAEGIAALLREARRASRGIRIEDTTPARVDAPRVVEAPTLEQVAPTGPTPVSAPAPVGGPAPVAPPTPTAAPTATATPTATPAPAPAPTPTPTAPPTATPAPPPSPTATPPPAPTDLALPPPPPPPPVPESAPAR
jgi:hypothetical protein